MTTRAEYHAQRNGGRWRKARVAHRCDWKILGWRCRHTIRPEERYFDTGMLNPTSSNERATYRICAGCANETIQL